jgi:hypothetical protein
MLNQSKTNMICNLKTILRQEYAHVVYLVFFFAIFKFSNSYFGDYLGVLDSLHRYNTSCDINVKGINKDFKRQTVGEACVNNIII